MRQSSLPAPIPATKKRSWKKILPTSFLLRNGQDLGFLNQVNWRGVWKKTRLFCSDECLLEDRIQRRHDHEGLTVEGIGVKKKTYTKHESPKKGPC